MRCRPPATTSEPSPPPPPPAPQDWKRDVCSSYLRPLSATARLHAADLDPLWRADLPEAAQAGLDRQDLRQGLRPLNHPHQPAATLDQAEGRAGHPRPPGRGRDACDADLRPLHPNRHRRPHRRRHKTGRETCALPIYGRYLQLHAYRLRISIPYGALTSRKLRKLAWIAKTYDKGYGHFTTRTNLQLHWIKLKDAPDILDHLAEVEMHAMQTSGNCIRNVTADPYAGATSDELDDPRVWAEAVRQWSTLHPEFTFLPRKFKIALTAAAKDRSAARIYDIGLALRRGRNGELGFEVMVGGGLELGRAHV